MKYIEQIKSFVLFFLVLLSAVLTFMIWSYKPTLQIIDETPVEQKMVGEKKNLNGILMPYRLLIKENNVWSGTVNSSTINHMMDLIASWQGAELTYVQSNVTDQKINDMVNTNGRMTIFFPSEIPIRAFNTTMLFGKAELPEITFNRLIIDWSKLSQNSLQLYFVSEKNRTLYNTTVSMSENYFNSTVKTVAKHLVDYQEIPRESNLSLYVPKESIELVQYTYYIDEISPDKFKEVLFNDPSIVKKNIESMDSSKYTDGMSLMTVDTKHKTLNYVYPPSESIVEIPASTLLYNSFEFLNDHGGFTGDYRYVSMNVSKHITEYQLFIKGYPVFSQDTSTRIATTWGENQIFRYKRPYYLLEMDISSEKILKKLPSGVEIMNAIQYSNMELEDISNVLVGYYLTKNDNDLLYTLEPSWFVIRNGVWTRITPEVLGGVGYGLE